jgi:hypothetical protein
MSRDVKDYVMASLVILIVVQTVFQVELSSEALVSLLSSEVLVSSLTLVTVIVAYCQLNTAIKTNSSNHTPLISIGYLDKSNELILSITNAGNSPVRIKTLWVHCTMENGSIESFDLVQKNKELSFEEALNYKSNGLVLETLLKKRVVERGAGKTQPLTSLKFLCDEVPIKENAGLAGNSTKIFFRFYGWKDISSLTDDEALIVNYFSAAIATLDFHFIGESVTGDKIEYSTK